MKSYSELEEKYLIIEVIKNASFSENNIKRYYARFRKINVRNVNKYKYTLEDYKEYIELWIHEIKCNCN